MRPSAALLAFLLLAPVSGWAWGQQGHAAVAALAEANLTPAARAAVAALLQGDLDAHGRPSGRTSLAGVAGWADEIREVAAPGTYEDWHVRDSPVCGDGPGPCRDGNCVDRLLARFAGVLGDRNAPQRARNEALKWVVHLVGDIHQPLHAGGNRDGNGDVPAAVAGRNDDTTLHWAWDNELAELALARGPLDGEAATAPAANGADAPARWMEEGRGIARTYVYAPLPGFACDVTPAARITLDAAYQEQAVPVIRRHLAKAGLRLAELLNEVLR